MDAGELSPDQWIVAVDSIVLFWINLGWSDDRSGTAGQLIQRFFKMQITQLKLNRLNIFKII